MTKLSPYQQKIVSKFEQGYHITVFAGINGGNDTHELVEPANSICVGDVNIKTIEKLLAVGIIKESTWTSTNGTVCKTYIKA